MSNIIDELLLLSSVRKIEDVPTRPLDMAAIVEKLHGDVGIVSDVGEGSTFWFTLPVAGGEE